MRRFVWIVCLLYLLMAPTIYFAYTEVEPAFNNPIIFVKQSPVNFTGGTIADIFNNVVGTIPLKSHPTGGGLFRLDPDGTLTNLTPFEQIAVRDPEISYDGQHVIFSMKRGALSKWQIYEMTVDGTGLRQISRGPNVNDWDPAYLPDGNIVFVSDRLEGIARRNENLPENQLPEGQMFIMDAGGAHILPVNLNPHGSFNPQVGENGLIYFTQWDLNDHRANPDDPPDGISYSRFLLWEAFTDGSREGHPSFGTHLIRDFAGGFTESREAADGSGEMVATLTQAQFTWGAGAIVRFMPRGNADQHSLTWLTPPEGYSQLDGHAGGRYRSPYPLSDGQIMASYAAGSVWDSEDQAAAPDFDLVILAKDGTHTLIHADPAFWDWQAVEVAARPAPQLAVPESKTRYNYAVVNARDVELRHTNDEIVINGDTQPVIPSGEAYAVQLYALGRPPAPYAGGDPSNQGLQRRYLGSAPVLEDGSFAAVIPSRMMVIWDVVDKEGNILVAERVWSEFAPGEVRSCNGCHSPHDGSTGRTTNLALMAPANLTFHDVDVDGNGVVDLIENYLLDVRK